MKDIVVFYHKQCTDGFSAAWAAWKKFGDTAEYVPTFHEEMPPTDVRDKEVYLLDLTFPEPVTRELMARNHRVTAIDHHQSSQAVTELTSQYSFDNNHSGAVLAWHYFHPDAPVPELLMSIEDMDLWKHAREGTNELYGYLDLHEYDFSSWSQLVADFEDPKKRQSLFATGATVLHHQTSMVKRLIERNARLVDLGGYRVLAVNNGVHELDSHLGHELAKRSPSGIGIAWRQVSDGMIAVSLRSVGDADVATLAKRYGGGGHHSAAGFLVASLADLPWHPVSD